MPITTETASLYASMPRFTRRKAFRQSLNLQEIMLAVAEGKEQKGSEKAKAALAWVALHELQRRMMGLGAPKAVPASNDPAIAGTKRKRGSAKPALNQEGPAE